MTEAQKAYVAGIIDGEGCLTARIEKSGYVNPRMTVAMCHKSTIEHLVTISESGKARPASRSRQAHNSDRPMRTLWRWTLIGHDARRLLEKVRPYLHTKQRQADIFLEIMAHRGVSVLKQQELAAELKAAKLDGCTYIVEAA